ncbi:MAG: hypothetical protein KA100_03590 [Rickettsiales bacterium]|nr:hypothetical protein [Rickettsiales bacterium]
MSKFCVKKILKNLGSVVQATCLFFVFFSANVFAQTIRPTTFDDRNICEDSKGVWRQFGNGCANNCESVFDKFAMCTNALVFSCDCGKNRCWNGETCLALKDYKKIYDIEAEKNQKILDAAKEKRKADALANEQEIMARLNPPDPNAPKPAEPAPVPAPKKPEPVIVQPVVVDPEAPTSPITQIPAPAPVNQEPVKVEIPPFLLKKQAQEEAKKAEEKKKEEEKKKSEGSKSVIIDGSLPPGLPVIPLPN